MTPFPRPPASTAHAPPTHLILTVKDGIPAPHDGGDGMSGPLLRLACTVALTTLALSHPADASVADTLTDLQRVYTEAEKATKAYDETAAKLAEQRAKVTHLDARLLQARLTLHASQGAAGRLARQQYQSSTDISPYVRLLLARDPQHALYEGHVIDRLAAERASTTARLTKSEQTQHTLTSAARKALDTQLTLMEGKKRARDEVRRRLGEVERVLVELTPEQLGELQKVRLTPGKGKGKGQGEHVPVYAGGWRVERGEGEEMKLSRTEF